MRTTLALDDELVAKAEALTGLKEKSSLVRKALKALIERESARHLRQREIVLQALADLPHASVATDGEVLHFIERHALSGRGIGYIDAHRLAAVKLTAGAELWTNDKRRHGVATQLGSALTPPRSRGP